MTKFYLNEANAKAVAAMCKLASKDKSRPVLQPVHFVEEYGTCTAYVTDSYRAMRYQFKSNGDGNGTVSVDARKLAETIKKGAFVIEDKDQRDGYKLISFTNLLDHSQTFLEGFDTSLARSIAKVLDDSEIKPGQQRINAVRLIETLNVFKAIDRKAAPRVSTNGAKPITIEWEEEGTYKAKAIIMPAKTKNN